MSPLSASELLSVASKPIKRLRRSYLYLPTGGRRQLA